MRLLIKYITDTHDYASLNKIHHRHAKYRVSAYYERFITDKSRIFGANRAPAGMDDAPGRPFYEGVLGYKE